MDRHRIAVVVEDDNLKQPPVRSAPMYRSRFALAGHPDGVVDCVLDVLVGNAVLTGVVHDLDLCRLPCIFCFAQVTLPRPL